MRIKFKQETWCLMQEGGGFAGCYQTRATLVKPEEFEVINVDPKGKRYSNIFVCSDMCMDGNSVFLINVPNELFEVVEK